MENQNAGSDTVHCRTVGARCKFYEQNLNNNGAMIAIGRKSYVRWIKNNAALFTSRKY